MCGNHSVHADHHHSGLHVPGPIGFVRPRLHRRAFLGYFGKGTAALAILGPVAAACSSGSSAVATETTGTPTTAAATTTSAAAEDPAASTTTAGSEPVAVAPEGMWARTNLDFVSAYVLARGNEVAIVDTGTSGSADAIGATISDLGLTYSDVKHVVLTHFHSDHAGSIAAVLEAAPNATGYVGELDLERIQTDVAPLTDGDDVFGMQVIHSPGHTPGHIALYDELTSTLVAGDAMNGQDGGVTGANPSFTPDMDTAAESVKKLSQLQFDTVYFGHGEPVIGGASDAVRDLAGQL